MAGALCRSGLLALVALVLLPALTGLLILLAALTGLLGLLARRLLLATLLTALAGLLVLLTRLRILLAALVRVLVWLLICVPLIVPLSATIGEQGRSTRAAVKRRYLIPNAKPRRRQIQQARDRSVERMSLEH